MFPLLRIRVNHKNAISSFNGSGRVKTHLWSNIFLFCSRSFRVRSRNLSLFFHMSRAGVIVTKYNLDSYFYILQDLDLIVPMVDKVDDKNKKTKNINKNHQLGQDQSPRPQTREMLMTHLRTLSSSFYQEEKSEASTSVSLDLFRNFLGKLDERFSVLESAIHQMPSQGKSASGFIKMAVPVKLQSQLSFRVNQMVCHLMKNLLIIQQRLEGMIIA